MTHAYERWEAGEINLDAALAAGMTEHEYMMATSGHEFRRSRLAGTLTCTRCGLLPLDDEDLETLCEPEGQCKS